MHNERAITNANEPEALTCEDYLIELFPIFNTALFTVINTVAASIGFAFMKQVAPKLTPTNESDAIKNAALSATIGFAILSLGCAFFSTRSTKKTPRERLSDTANIFYPLACTDLVLAFPLPLLSAYFIYNLSLLDATMIGVNTVIGANMLLIPTLIAAMLFQAGHWLKPKDTIPVKHLPENKGHPIVRSEASAETTNNSINHTIIHVESADQAHRQHIPSASEVHHP